MNTYDWWYMLHRMHALYITTSSFRTLWLTAYILLSSSSSSFLLTIIYFFDLCQMLRPRYTEVFSNRSIVTKTFVIKFVKLHPTYANFFVIVSPRPYKIKETVILLPSLFIQIQQSHPLDSRLWISCLFKHAHVCPPFCVRIHISMDWLLFFYIVGAW